MTENKIEEVGATECGRIIYTISPESVEVGEGRIREEFDRKKLDNLKTSIKDKGQLSPAICSLEEKGIILVAGERRLRVCRELKIPFQFLLTEETDPLRIREIEVEENVCRVQLSWPEELKSVEELHSLKQQLYPPSPGRLRGGGHTLADTAELVGKSEGTVSEDLEIAKFMDLEEVRNAKTKTEAKKVIQRIKDDFARNKALKEAQALEREESTEEGESLPLQEEEEKEITEESSREEILKKINFFSPKVLEGKMEIILSEEQYKEYFDIVFLDSPWGQDINEVETTDGSKEEFDDSHELFVTKLEEWLSACYYVMSSHSHLYMFFGIKDHAFVYQTLEKVGFEVNWMPIFWHKVGTHRVRNPKKWPGRSYEAIAFARKGDKPLQWQGASDIASTPSPSPAMKQSQRTAKHPDIYLNLLKRSGFPGDKVLDPMCGSGMFGVACEVMRVTHQFEWLMIEEKEEFVRLSIANLVKSYSNITRAPIERRITASDDMEVPEDFREISVGTEKGDKQWIAYWKQHPERQEEMLEWKKKQKELS